MAEADEYFFTSPDGDTLPLVDAIPESFSSSNFDGSDRDYLPESCLNQLVILESIEKVLGGFRNGLHTIRPQLQDGFLEKFNSDLRHTLAIWIYENARRVFAVMVHCNISSLHLLVSLRICRDNEFTDDKLPLTDPKLLPESWNKTIWPAGKLRDFYDKQWKFLVPVFSPNEYHYNHRHNCIFPFTKANVLPRVGAFSTVHKVTVHPDHQKHERMHEVAIKEIKINRGNDRAGTDEAWNSEARALENINAIDHDHIIKCVAAIRRGDSRYFMFPWADGDSLREHWNRVPKQKPDAETIYQAVTQLRGLADALDRLHNYETPRSNSTGDAMDLDHEFLDTPNVQVQDEDDEISRPVETSGEDNIRHGDLKPENILCFTTSRPGFGVLKIADMGLAKRHIAATQDRSHLTSTRYGTIHYEPPEAAPGFEGSRSRLYDIWSMGCITLEMIIWILHGNEELTNFYTQVKGGTKKVCQYYDILETETGPRPVLHPKVREWIEHLAQNEPECSHESALGDLLGLVRTKLLVVNLSPTRKSNLNGGRGLALPEGDDTTAHYRCTAAQFKTALNEIIDKADQTPGYLLVGKPRYNVKLPSPEPSNSLTPNAAAHERKGNLFSGKSNILGQLDVGVLSNHVDRNLRSADYTLPPLKDWEFNVDNDFAERLVTQVRSITPKLGSTNLCNRCIGLNFWAAGFSMGDTMAALLDRSDNCDFCRMLVKASSKRTNVSNGRVQVERKQSNLILLGDSFPLLSIFRSPDSQPPFEIQMGLPQLPESGSDAFFSILNLWLQDCTEGLQHKDCQEATRVKLPTRLIEVGSVSNPLLRLVETATGDIFGNTYIALSHPWGDSSSYVPFTTTRYDLSRAGRDLEHFKEAIPEYALPATFRDAVICTRQLGVRYLWIDSLCILQGNDGDFNDEAKKMEDVYSGAYCVIAASRASNQLDGFLKPRPQCDYVTFQRHGEKPFYICENIDHFSRDVIEGPLNKRGWVLQERALARRTIYFTENQTYFECGKGVRCETLTSMRNNMADFLGDPHFPAKAMRTTSRALKISYFQELYKQYSRLSFTRPDDRPFAIAGLEKRLLSAYGTPGGYGIFDDGTTADGGLFHRSLLWRRGEDCPRLSPIQFPASRNIHVPSWSWMAYMGGIEYADPPFQRAEWEMSDISPPWTRSDTQHFSSAPLSGMIAIPATVREYEVAVERPTDVNLVFDRPQPFGSDGRRAHCVVVAKSNERGWERQKKRYYVLLLAPTQERTDRNLQIFRRIGAGYMLGKHIVLDRSGTPAMIV